MALAEEIAPPPKGPSLVMQIAALLIVTLFAAGLGWGAGMMLRSEATPAGEQAEAAPAPAKPGEHGGAKEEATKEGHDAAPVPGADLLVAMAPMTTNLAAPSQIWVRLEASLVLDAPQPPELIEAVHQDLFAYLRTVKMHQIEGASGYKHLKADLDERARIRSAGHVTQVLVRTLLFE